MACLLPNGLPLRNSDLALNLTTLFRYIDLGYSHIECLVLCFIETAAKERLLQFSECEGEVTPVSL